MCAIVDANAAFEVFSERNKRSDAGVEFFKWIESGTGRLVVGGKLVDELQIPRRPWAQDLILAAKMTIVNRDAVNAKAEQLRQEGSCSSDDPHIIALALVSGARLLYTNDHRLMEDFKKLVKRPPGKIYPTRGDERSRKRLLHMRNLCHPPKQPA